MSETFYDPDEAISSALRLLTVAVQTIDHLATRGDLPRAFPVNFLELRRVAVGDFVMEMSTENFPERDRDRFGRLVKIAEEPATGLEEWDEVREGRPRPLEHIYYLATLDGRLFRWHNCSFLKLSERMHSHVATTPLLARLGGPEWDAERFTKA